MKQGWIKILALCLTLCAAAALCFGRAAQAQDAGAPPRRAAPTAAPETPEPTPTPTPVPEIALPDGRSVKQNVKTLDLSGMKGSETAAFCEVLPRLTELETVRLGRERDGGPDWEQIAALRGAAPQAAFDYRFTLYGLDVKLEDETLDLNHIEIDDRGELVRRVIACMPRLNFLCMDSCGVEDEDMAAIREDFPGIEVVWRIWFGGGKVYSVRTNVEKILASKTSWAGEMTNEYVAPIRYCNRVKYLDLGHNQNITDISFVRSMPELEVFIIAMNPELRDISPLEDCPKLEYLELFNTGVEDLSPLTGLTELRHLNLGQCWLIEDLSPIYPLELERLYIGVMTLIPHEQIEEYRRLHPDCDVNDTLADSSQGTWRYLDESGEEYAPRYALLREQFGYADMAYSVFWLDPDY